MDTAIVSTTHPVLMWDEDALADQWATQARRERAEVDQALEDTRRDSVTWPEATSWMSMSEAERARIRPPRRRTADGSLILLRGEGQPAAPSVGEVA